jgi:hypothetical protein
MTKDVDPKLLEQFGKRLQDFEGETTRINLKLLWSEFETVFKHRQGSYKRREVLLEGLRLAESQGIIKLPKTAWEESGDPQLPKYVTRILKVSPIKEQWWIQHPWDHRLDWVHDLPQLTKEHGDFLLKVQEGFKNGWFETNVPLKYRSVQLTRKEKRLGELKKTILFGAGRLSLELLGCVSDVMPLAYEIIGTKPIALVFENKEPYNVALEVLHQLSHPPYGIIAYGGGGSFQDSVRSFSNIQTSQRYQQQITRPLERIEYVGDLDWAGLKIAYEANRKAQQHGLPMVAPAVGLHRIMLESLSDPTINSINGFPDNEIKKDRKSHPQTLEWLPEEVREEIKHILELKNRIPEEMITSLSLLKIWRKLEET